MKNFPIITSLIILGSISFVSCSSNKLATSESSDNLYFMASDAKIATEYAVQNNNPEQFQSLSSTTSQAIPQESFSSRNVNPDYIARYQEEQNTEQNEVVYFDDEGQEEYNPNIDAYNNYKVGGSGNNSNFNSNLSAFNMGMMYGLNSYGINRLYDPFFGSGFGFRPGFNMNIGYGFGNPFLRPMYGMGGFRYGGFYDPYNPYYGYGYPRYGYSPMYSSNPSYTLPGGEFGDRRVIRGARGTRGSTLGAARSSTISRSAVQPSTARAQARREVLGTGTNDGARRSLSNSNNSRVSARDFSSTQNDYYNSTSRAANSRNVNSAAMDRPVTRSRSAMPSARPSVNPSNSRNVDAGRAGTIRNSYPTNSRSASPSYNRSNVPSRSSSPAYNRGNTNSNSRTVSPTRSTTPTRTITPTRSNNPSYSTPSRSSGNNSSTGGASRSTSTPTRGGRGN